MHLSLAGTTYGYTVMYLQSVCGYPSSELACVDDYSAWTPGTIDMDLGAGLAGCEAAWQIARRGVHVRLHEMRPARPTPAHKTGLLAELVCSNSFRSDDAMGNAVGLLHEEMRRLGSLILAICSSTHAPASTLAKGLPAELDRWFELYTEYTVKWAEVAEREGVANLRFEQGDVVGGGRSYCPLTRTATTIGKVQPNGDPPGRQALLPQAVPRFFNQPVQGAF